MARFGSIRPKPSFCWRTGSPLLDAFIGAPPAEKLESPQAQAILAADAETRSDIFARFVILTNVANERWNLPNAYRGRVPRSGVAPGLYRSARRPGCQSNAPRQLSQCEDNAIAKDDHDAPVDT